MRPAILIAALALAACGSDSKTTTMTGTDGKTATVTTTGKGDAATIVARDADGNTATQVTGAGATWPADAPAYAPAYPRAAIAMSMGGSSKDGAGGMVSFTTPDKPAAVIAFYEAKAKAAGLGEVSTVTAGETRMFGAKDAAGNSLSVQTSISDGKTDAAVIFGKGKA